MDLQPYYDEGRRQTIRPMSKQTIRKLYFEWLRFETERSWDEVWCEKLLKHNEYWAKKQKQYQEKFVPIILGKVEIADDGLYFYNKFYPRLKISAPKMSKAWIKRKVRDYCAENLCSIDYKDLVANSVTDIKTKISL